MYFKTIGKSEVNSVNQIKGSVLKLNERRTPRQQSLFLKPTMDKETLVETANVENLPEKENSDLDNLSEMQRENIRRFILSPFHLDNVPKPRKVLFEKEKPKSKQAVARDLTKSRGWKTKTSTDKPKHLNDCSVNEIQTAKTDKKASMEKEEQNQAAAEKKSSARKDYILKELTEMIKRNKALDDNALTVNLEVNSKYYQKWARNKRVSSKYIFPSLIQNFRTHARFKAESRRSSRCSRRDRTRRTAGKRVGVKTPISENNTASTDSSKSQIKREGDNMFQYDGNNGYVLEQYQENEIFECYISDGEDYYGSSEESEYDDISYDDYDAAKMDSKKAADETMEGISYPYADRSGIQQVAPLPSLETVLNSGLSGVGSGETENIHLGDDVTDIISESEIDCENELSEARKVCLDNENVELKDEKVRLFSKGYVPLTTNEISTSLLDNVALPVDRTLNSVRRESLNLASRRIFGMTKLKKNRYNSTSFQTERTPLTIKKSDKPKHQNACSIIDNVQNFRCNRQTTRLREDTTKPVLNRSDTNRIPVKMAKSSPRYTGPESMIVDFESLRIAAHLQRLKTKPHSPQTEIALKVLRNAKTYEKMPSIEKNGFKTVISGCAVK